MSTTDADAVASSGSGGDVPRDLTSFQQAILTVLADEPKYGLAIKRELEEYYGEEVNHGRLYPNLDELVELDLLEKSELDKRTNQYELTEYGFETILDRVEWTLDRVLEADEDRRAAFEELVETYS